MGEFVDSLKTELESAFRKEISVYFDINPTDGFSGLNLFITGQTARASKIKRGSTVLRDEMVRRHHFHSLELTFHLRKYPDRLTAPQGMCVSSCPSGRLIGVGIIGQGPYFTLLNSAFLRLSKTSATAALARSTLIGPSSVT